MLLQVRIEFFYHYDRGTAGKASTIVHFESLEDLKRRPVVPDRGTGENHFTVSTSLPEG